MQFAAGHALNQFCFPPFVADTGLEAMAQQIDSKWIELQKVIRSVLLSQAKTGIKANAFGRIFKELYQEPLNFRKYGFKSILELMENMPETVR